LVKAQGKIMNLIAVVVTVATLLTVVLAVVSF